MATQHQYEPLKIPSHWNTEEKKFVQQLTDLLDNIYSWRNRLRFEDMNSAFQQRITSAEGNISSIQQDADSIELRVQNAENELSTIHQEADSITLSVSALAEAAAAGAVIFRQNDEPTTGMKVGDIWVDTDDDDVTYCYNGAAWLATNSAGVSNSSFRLDSEGLRGIGKDVTFQTDAFNVTSYADADVKYLTVTDEGVTIYGNLIASPNILGNVMNTFAGGNITWAGTIQGSLDNTGKQLLADSTLTILAGHYREDIDIRGFKGARLQVIFAPGAFIDGTLTMSLCDNVYLYAAARTDAGAEINGITAVATGETTVYGDICGLIHINNLNIHGYMPTSGTRAVGNGTRNTVQLRCSHIIVENTLIDTSCERAISCGQGATGYVNNCLGGVVGGSDPATVANLGWGVRPSYGAHISHRGTCFASVSGNVAYDATLVTGGSITDTASDATAAATPSTKSYAVSAGYYRKAQTTGVGSWTIGEPRQGYAGEWVTRYGTAGWGYYRVYEYYYHMGAFFLTNAGNIVPDIPGGMSITAATLTLKRTTYGNSGDVTLYLYMHDMASYTGSFNPSTGYVDTGLTATFGPGQTETITLDAGVIAALNAGTCKGFGLMHTGSVIKMEVSGSLLVTYS